jgi:sialate O-acetylesterase
MYRLREIRKLWMCVLVVSLALAARAEVELPHVFGSHMVLQQGEKVPIWGSADPVEKVMVSIGGQKVSAVADGDGAWEVTLNRMKASGPHVMTVEGEENTIMFTDVLVGEVWVCSGQSNMQWTVKNSKDEEKEIAAADYPNIRLFYVERKVSDEPEDDCNGEWKVCSPQSIPEFSAVAYYFGREVHTASNVPVGLIHTSWGGTPAESWTTIETLRGNPMFEPILERWKKTMGDYPQAKAEFDKQLAEWEQAVEKAKAEGASPPSRPREPMGPDHPWRPSGLYNAMIAPLQPFAIRGAIWYQGESNAGRAYQYRTLFPAMIEDWRRTWGQSDSPFLFVQLANFQERKPDPGDSDWAELREAQSMTLSLPNTGMAVIIDIGEAGDIHPKNKQDVGKRLALNALAKVYDKDVVYSGPIFKSMRLKDGKIALSFNHVDGGLMTPSGEPLKGFAIAGADKKFVWANAEINGKRILVWSDDVKEPVAVRYAWAINPECNLFNSVGLPASPFRTDDWPGVTVDQR